VSLQVRATLIIHQTKAAGVKTKIKYALKNYILSKKFELKKNSFFRIFIKKCFVITLWKTHEDN
jgi:hypothetical protein